jgi:hypothetical protein
MHDKEQEQRLITQSRAVKLAARRSHATRQLILLEPSWVPSTLPLQILFKKGGG